MFKYVYQKNKVTIRKTDLESTPRKPLTIQVGGSRGTSINPAEVREGTKEQQIEKELTNS